MKKIAIDIDNTILNYHPFFDSKKLSPLLGVDLPVSGKDGVKNYLLNSFIDDVENGEKLWLKAQRICYGDKILEVEIYDGFLRFVEKVKSEGYIIEFFSHKTERPYDGSDIDLRGLCRERLEQESLLKDINVYFFESLDQKIEALVKASPLLIIDDLEKLIYSDRLSGFFKIHWEGRSYSDNIMSLSSWSIVSELLTSFLKINYQGELLQKVISPSSNNLFFLKMDKPKFLKIYSSRNKRLEKNVAEKKNIKLLLSSGALRIPNICYSSDNLLLSEEVVGNHPFLEKKDHLDLIDFAFDLSKKFETLEDSLVKGSHFRLSYRCYWGSLEKRQKELNEQYIGKVTDGFFLSLIENIFDLIEIKKQKFSKSVNDSCFDYKFEEHFFCMGDLSEQNLIENEKGLHFIDFECWGLNDPVKWIVDYTLHPSNKIDFKDQKEYVDYFLEKFGLKYQELLKRYQLVLGVLQCEWFLIVLSRAIDLFLAGNQLYLTKVRELEKQLSIYRGP